MCTVVVVVAAAVVVVAVGDIVVSIVVVIGVIVVVGKFTCKHSAWISRGQTRETSGRLCLTTEQL